MKRFISIILALMMLVSCFAGLSLDAFAGGPPQNGWFKNYAGVWFYYVDGSPTTGWKLVSGKWYYFDEDGWMVCDTVYDVNSIYYSFDASGAMQTGWIKKVSDYGGGSAEVNWFYGQSNGALVQGWQKIGGTWYYFEPAMVSRYTTYKGELYAFNRSGAWVSSGWAQDSNGEWRYVKNGIALTGWQKINGTWYYFSKDDGSMYIGSWNIDGKIYFFNGSGAWVAKPANGWNSAKATLYTGMGKAYTYTEWAYYQNGKPATGWKKIGGKWYFFNTEHGNMYANEATYANDNETTYYFNPDGSLREKERWVQLTYDDGIKGQWYYVRSDGTCVKGWIADGEKFYCLNSYDGGMYADTVVYDEDSDYWYYVGKDGAVVINEGWVALTEKSWTYGITCKDWFYITGGGPLQTGWLNLNDKLYYFEPEYPVMYADGDYMINGENYTFAPSGECIGVG